MPPAPTQSLRERRRTQLLAHIRHTAHQLFAERGFDNVTTEEIAAAAGVSISTYYRHTPSKEGLLVEPIREAMAEIVAAYSNRLATESAVEALIHVFVTHAHTTRDLNREMWHQAISTTPHLLSTTTLITDRDRDRSVNGNRKLISCRQSKIDQLGFIGRRP
ncbi:TetR/AcrR family transcriptional regulator [Mycobacterium intracellulare]|uniref:TetR/AcrR family transcriptional regulator n=1 Tax=Mycobacterium intracellulare TaxID=1767 RepID=UPI001E5FD6BF|nr:TetR/AcrR family transcriptional regulator [Mycobacterium intracellulare]UGT99166.1 TetR/AcrR family transcriptional regulator [Mycobacterium intracellulare]